MQTKNQIINDCTAVATYKFREKKKLINPGKGSKKTYTIILPMNEKGK